MKTRRFARRLLLPPLPPLKKLEATASSPFPPSLPGDLIELVDTVRRFPPFPTPTEARMQQRLLQELLSAPPTKSAPNFPMVLSPSTTIHIRKMQHLLKIWVQEFWEEAHQTDLVQKADIILFISFYYPSLKLFLGLFQLSSEKNSLRIKEIGKRMRIRKAKNQSSHANEVVGGFIFVFSAIHTAGKGSSANPSQKKYFDSRSKTVAD